MQADPHEAVRLARRLEGLLERELAVPSLAVRVHGAVHDHAAHLPPRVAGSSAHGPRHPPRPPARPTRPGCSTAYRDDPHAAGAHLPAVGPRRAPPPCGGRPLVAPRPGGARTERPGALQAEPAGPGGRRAAGLVRGQRARAWSRPCRRWTPTAAWPTWAGDRPGSSTRAAWPTRRRCTAGTRSAAPSTPTLAVDGVDEHLELFAPLAPGDALTRARHDPPARHRHRRRVARRPSGRAASPSSTATPRATSRSAAPPATCCSGRGTGCRSTTASRCSATPRPARRLAHRGVADLTTGSASPESR